MTRKNFTFSRWCRDGLVCASHVRHANEVIDELERARSELVTSSVEVGDAFGSHADNQRLLDNTEKQLYQRIVAKLNYFAHVWLDLRCATSCLASAAHPRPGVLLCAAGAYWASGKVSRRSTSGGVVTHGCGVLSCWAEKQRSVARSSWQSGQFSATRAGTRSLGIQSELKDLAS